MRIKKITVSRGLSETVASWYGCPAPDVVRSAIPATNQASELASVARLDKTLLFFGTPERLPLGLLDALCSAGVSLHIYGGKITEESFGATLQRALPDNVSILGAYEPSDISFVAHYRYLILYKPEINTLNFRFSLPNKFFQALASGTSVVVSSNFQEMVETVNHIPGAIAEINGPDELIAAMTALDTLRSDFFWERVVSASNKMHNDARDAYRGAIGLSAMPG